MHIMVTFFGGEKYLPLVERITAQLEAVGVGRPTLLMNTMDPAPDGFKVVRVDPSRYIHRLMRQGNRGECFDYKACLWLEYLREVHDDWTLILDADNFVYRDPRPDINKASTGLFLPPDGGKRMISHPAVSVRLEELTSSFALFPPDSRMLVDLFQIYWKSSKEKDHYLLEQRTWSLVCHATGTILPRTYAWSRFWKQAPKDCVVYHPHGDEKWRDAPEYPPQR